MARLKHFEGLRQISIKNKYFKPLTKYPYNTLDSPDQIGTVRVNGVNEMILLGFSLYRAQCREEPTHCSSHFLEETFRH